MNNFIDLIKREFRLFASNSVVLAIFIGAPLLYGLLLGAVYSKGKVDNLPILVVDMDDSPMSHRAIEMLNDAEVLTVTVHYDQQEVRKGIITDGYEAVVTIPYRFEADIIQKRHPEIQVEVNTANILPANYAAKAIQVALGTLNAGIEIQSLTKTGMPLTTAKESYEAFSVNYARFFNKSANYMTFLWPGVLGVILQQVFMLAMALSFAREQEENTFLTEFYPRVRNPWYAMLIKSLPFWLMGLGVLAALWAMFPLFKVPMQVHGLGMIALLAGLIFSVTMMGISVSLAIPSQLKATEVLMVIATPSFILSGFTWPLSQMPDWVVGLANTIPLTHFLEGLRKLMFYGATLNDIWPQLSGLLYISVFFMVLNYILFKTIPRLRMR
ncbi:ABC transporter permease [Carboxylicivirga sediminis]|uniref:ABC transporter permease n=1 Tax=Carboxylicivirga sediminis TaxID=2006564 RepID=A0A941F899_9BACT|nr:ABC transporter permease [Carboxylicivirga sediminis]MBR8537578.1 ABC transporter permease [Carboxylicivirga sediminis]